MFNIWGTVFDLNAFIFILLTLIFSVKLYQLVKLQSFIWLVLATGCGTILRAIHLLRNFGVLVPDSQTVSHWFALFYILLFLGVYAYYKPIKRMWNSQRG